MSTLPAYDEITLDFGTHAVVLRPSLRAAMRLERLHHGFPALLRKVEEFDTRTVKAMITASADKADARGLLRDVSAQPLSGFQAAAQGPLFALVAGMLLQPRGEKVKPKTNTGVPMPWAEVFVELFKLATGWLGWTPETAWQATPQEITDAFDAHVAKLKAIHGGTDDDDATGDLSGAYTPDHLRKIEEQGRDPTFDRAGLHALKGMGAIQ